MEKRTKLRILAPAWLAGALFLAACGGGGGGGGNQSPVADAGSDQTVAGGDTVTLDASGSSDPDGDTLSFNWTQTGGPAVELSGANAAQATFVAPDVEETLTFDATVSDGQGATASDSITISVTPADLTPDAFTFAPLSDVAPGLVHASEPVAVQGLSEGRKASVSVAGGEYAIGDGAFTSEPGEVSNGESIRMRVTAAETGLAEASATLDIGGVQGEFTVTTGEIDFVTEIGAGRINFGWLPFEGVSHYRLLENPDSVSGFTPVADNIPGDADSFVHQLPVHLTRWEDAIFQLEACNENGCAVLPDHELMLTQLDSVGAIKRFDMPRTPYASATYGVVSAISGDGFTVAVASDPTVRLGSSSSIRDGFVSVLVRTEDGDWQHHATLDPVDNARDAFGASLAFNHDGSVLAIGMPGDGDEHGSVRVYVRDDENWASTTVTPDVTAAGDRFGFDVALNAAGTRLAVSAPREDSASTGINGNATANCGSEVPANCAEDAGAAYLFALEEGEWRQTSYFKASNTGAADEFGYSLAFVDGALLVGAWLEDSAATDVGGDQNDNSAEDAGAAYLFVEDEARDWQQVAYLKASNTGADDRFGFSVALPVGASYLAIGARGEDGAIGGINPQDGEGNNGRSNSGAAYVFEIVSDQWQQVAHIKMPNPTHAAGFGNAMSASTDSRWLAVGAYQEGRFNDEAASRGVHSRDLAQREGRGVSGAVFLYERSETGEWAERAFVKAPNPSNNDRFGTSVAIADNGSVLVVGAPGEDDENNSGTTLNNIGGAYVY